MIYDTHIIGKHVETKDIDTVLEDLKYLYTCQQEENDRLRNRNKELQDEHWKDETLQKMKTRLELVEDSARRGFPISEEESKKISQWKKNHIEQKHGGQLRAGAIGGAFSYIFTPSSIGVFASCKCTCGEEFNFRMGD